MAQVETELTLVRQKTLSRPQNDFSTQSCWYEIWQGECPLCGSDQSYKERKTEPKPDNREDRVRQLSSTEAYCGCTY